MRYIVHKRLKPFSTAHYLPTHDGPCQNVHGHNFHLEVEVEGTPTPVGDYPDSGMVVEFSEIKKAYETHIFPRLDHRFVNDAIPELPVPTTEMLAAWIFNQFLDAGVPLTGLRLWETDDNSVRITRG
jgi:6-pyruvoyltetrahydropterin/6-carboxytetrahydropterin synthase